MKPHNTAVVNKEYSPRRTPNYTTTNSIIKVLGLKIVGEFLREKGGFNNARYKCRARGAMQVLLPRTILQMEPVNL